MMLTLQYILVGLVLAVAVIYAFRRMKDTLSNRNHKCSGCAECPFLNAGQKCTQHNDCQNCTEMYGKEQKQQEKFGNSK